jgi:uncharacterized small protein (DUF1192 family)
MGEIKSTLDLVMERTRHLSLSAEEKARQQREDFEKRLHGLLQQYADGALSVDELGERIAALQTECKITGRQIPLQAVFKRIDPKGDNQCWLDFLAELAPAVRDPLQEALSAHRRQQAGLMRECEARIREDLARRHGIEGSAVVPNPQRDAAYGEHLAALRHQTQSRIEAISPRVE